MNEHDSIFAAPRATFEQTLGYLVKRHAAALAKKGIFKRRLVRDKDGHTLYADYNEYDLRLICSYYFNLAQQVGVDPVFVIAQIIKETESLTAFWSLRGGYSEEDGGRNPAGIGVDESAIAGTADKRPAGAPAPLWRYNYERSRWEKGLSFADWQSACRVHLGRLLSWCLKREPTALQQQLMDESQARRQLPAVAFGSATNIKELGQAHNRSGYGWAYQGVDYGEKIAAIVNEIVKYRADSSPNSC